MAREGQVMKAGVAFHIRPTSTDRTQSHRRAHTEESSALYDSKHPPRQGRECRALRSGYGPLRMRFWRMAALCFQRCGRPGRLVGQTQGATELTASRDIMGL
jgi:hypothetical protein